MKRDTVGPNMSGTRAHLLILESDCKKIYRIMITSLNKGLFNVLLRLVQPSWCGTFEGTGTIFGLLHKATLLVLDGHTKEICITTFLLAKKVLRMRRKAGLLFTALYLKQCGSSLQKAYGGDPSTGLLPFPVSLTRKGYPTIIPSFHRKMIYSKDEKADMLVQLSLSWFSLAKVIQLAKPLHQATFESTHSQKINNRFMKSWRNLKPSVVS